MFLIVHMTDTVKSLVNLTSRKVTDDLARLAWDTAQRASFELCIDASCRWVLTISQFNHSLIGEIHLPMMELESEKVVSGLRHFQSKD